MNRSISKIRHIQNLNKRIENRYLFEDVFDDSLEMGTEIISNNEIDDDSNEEFKNNCKDVIDLMEDIIDKLEDCCESEDSVNDYLSNCSTMISKLIIDLRNLNNNYEK